ncbi:hypothetical protein [Glutamicibacter nicotianae]|uniref:hypothetical protein n=1 Tax=Glutamicibacter nicotianae TaxID=37929 RepID=UPI002553DA7B|nr:hypothetical protein [Glutamicibacter nicotianae]WIV44507.1 hypothetical protein QQS42_02485 [Glutamicibacter nicotianae]
MPTLSPQIVEKRSGTYLEITVRAQVNRHEPEIVLYIIDSGRYYYVSETRTGIGGTIYRHKELGKSKDKALGIVRKRYQDGMWAFEKRTTLYG